MSGAGERIRLFAALELPEEIVESLVSWRGDAAGSLPGLRMLDPQHLHTTLCFLGWQASEASEAIADACRSVVDETPAPELVVGRPVWLPARRPRVLAVELGDRDGGLARLQAALSARLEAGGWYVPERRPYLGHVTVARARHGASPRPTTLYGPAERSFRASRVTLFRSVLAPVGARYEAVARMAFTSSA